MPNEKISGLGAASALAGGEQVEVVQVGVNKKATMSQVRDYIFATGLNASETVKGVAELLDQPESEAVATAGTSPGADHTRVVSGRGLWWFWTKIKTLTQTISGVWTFSASPISPTPAASDNSTKLATTEYTDRAVGSAFQDTTTLAIYKISNFGTP